MSNGHFRKLLWHTLIKPFSTIRRSNAGKCTFNKALSAPLS
jgi:hypothetical protein